MTSLYIFFFFFFLKKDKNKAFFPNCLSQVRGCGWLEPLSSSGHEEGTHPRQSALPKQGALTPTPLLTQIGTVWTHQFASHACFWGAGGKQSTWRRPTQSRGKMCTGDADAGPARSQTFLLLIVVYKREQSFI